MDKRKFRLHDGKTGAALTVRVVPNAKRTELQGIMTDGTLKIKVAAPPVEGKANKMLVDFLSEILKIPKTNIEIVAGALSRDKLISVTGIDPEAANRNIRDYKKSQG
jgi:uncharacterized protein (TIGR00251 family)